MQEARVFQTHLKRIRDAVFAERRVHVAKLCRDVVVLVREEGSGLGDAQRKAAKQALERLRERYGYDDASAADAGAALMHARFSDLLT